MPNDLGQISFMPVEPSHYSLLLKWLNEPHVREWWGDPQKELGFIRDMVEGRDSTRPFIFAVAGEPVGYIQCWYVGDQQKGQWLEDNPWLADMPPEAVGVDLTIGIADRLSKGIGSRALIEFTRKLFEDGHRTIIIDPDRDNTRAVRAYTKAGFRSLPHLEGRTGDVLIMQYDPNTIETMT